MKISGWSGFLVFVFLTTFVSGCAPALAPTPTPTPIPPTFTPSPIPATFTPIPTATATPDVAATQEADGFNKLLNSFVSLGYLDSTAGNIQALNPTAADWNTGSWSPNNVANAPKTFSDFLFSAHFAWDAVAGSPQDLGCAVVFGLQEDATNAQYVLMFNKSSISVSWLTSPPVAACHIFMRLARQAERGG